MPVELIDWIHEMLMLEDGQCVDYSLVGSQTSGNGFTDMVSNQEYIYVIRNLKEEDGLAFKMQFPKCKIYMYQQYD